MVGTIPITVVVDSTPENVDVVFAHHLHLLMATDKVAIKNTLSSKWFCNLLPNILVSLPAIH